MIKQRKKIHFSYLEVQIKLNRLAREIERLKDKSKTDLEQLHHLLRGAHDTRTKLIKELGKITHVYCNGKEASFSELFELEDSK